MPASSLPATPPQRTWNRRGFVNFKPQYAPLLAAAGLKDAASFLELDAELISGHPGRNVARLTLDSPSGPMRLFLKREYRIRWTDRLKSWRAGYGWSSVSCREAAALDCVHQLGLPAPEWMANGEDGNGGAFLLLRAVDGVDLRRYLLSMQRSATPLRRSLAQLLGQRIAGTHDAGIAHPDLYAKHIMIDPEARGITILDWQRTPRPHVLSVAERARDLAALHVSIAEELADRDDRRAFLLSYYRASRATLPAFAAFCRQIEDVGARLTQRNSVREQRLPTWHDSQSLFWLDGESLAVTSRCRQIWPACELQRLAYSHVGNRSNTYSVTIFTPEMSRACLTIRRTIRPLGRIHDWWRGRRWTAPELRTAAHMLRQERLGAAPRLLAFGQKVRPGGVVDSFLLADAEAA